MNRVIKLFLAVTFLFALSFTGLQVSSAENDTPILQDECPTYRTWTFYYCEYPNTWVTQYWTEITYCDKTTRTFYHETRSEFCIEPESTELEQ